MASSPPGTLQVLLDIVALHVESDETILNQVLYRLKWLLTCRGRGEAECTVYTCSRLIKREREWFLAQFPTYQQDGISPLTHSTVGSA